MLTTLAATLPVIFLIVLGVVLKQRFLPSPDLWRGIEFMTYWLFTPSLFFSTIVQVDLSGVPFGSLVIAMIIPWVVATLLVLATALVVTPDGPRLTSQVQGAVRINTYVGIVLISILHGQEGLALFAIASALGVPIANLMAVPVLARWGARPEGQPRPNVLREVVTNPMIVSCVAALAFNLGGISIPTLILEPISLLGGPALVLGTLAAGAALRLSISKADVLDVAISSIAGMIIMPLGGYLIASALGVDGLLLLCIVLVTALPVAPSAVILAGRLGGDVPRIAAITGAQTVLCVITIPLLLLLVPVA